MVKQTVAQDSRPQSNEELAQLFNHKSNITRNVKIVMETIWETIRVAIVRVETRRHHWMFLVPHLTRLSPRRTKGFAVQVQPDSMTSLVFCSTAVVSPKPGSRQRPAWHSSVPSRGVCGNQNPREDASQSINTPSFLPWVDNSSSCSNYLLGTFQLDLAPVAHSNDQLHSALFYWLLCFPLPLSLNAPVPKPPAANTADSAFQGFGEPEKDESECASLSEQR